jgi:hypothetical protein
MSLIVRSTVVSRFYFSFALDFVKSDRSHFIADRESRVIYQLRPMNRGGTTNVTAFVRLKNEMLTFYFATA